MSAWKLLKTAIQSIMNFEVRPEQISIRMDCNFFVEVKHLGIAHIGEILDGKPLTIRTGCAISSIMGLKILPFGIA